jgi:hypothetical protein
MKLYDKEVIKLSKILKNNSYIDSLSFMGNEITDKGAIALSKLKHIKTLNLGHNYIT